ncbi:hypothetical protein [Halomontanus rarus]|uniref:hypothetical protein n=1 Tax=Halomontanus rarus TaxID=3034020 RepID=UPI001A99DAAD
MELSMSDVTVYVYNVAVLITGGFLVMELQITDRAVLIGLAFVLGLFWTAYFRYSMAPKLAAMSAENDEGEGESEGGSGDPDRL